MTTSTNLLRDSSVLARVDPHPPASYPELAGVRHAFVEVAGARIHYVEAGAGEPLVLLHGWPQHWWCFRKVIPALAKKYRVICPDLRGLGWSEGSPPGHHFLAFAADLVGFMDALGLAQIRLVGHDWGAAIGYTTCLHWPRRVERFVALAAITPWFAAAPWSDSAALWRLSLQAWHVYALGLLGRFALRVFRLRERALRVWRHVGSFTREELDIYLERMCTPAAERATVRWYGSALRVELPYYMKHHREIRLSTRTLHLNGACDPLTKGMRHGFRHPNAPHMELELLPDCGHFIAEERPEQLLARLETFFA